MQQSVCKQLLEKLLVMQKIDILNNLKIVKDNDIMHIHTYILFSGKFKHFTYVYIITKGQGKLTEKLNAMHM